MGFTLTAKAELLSQKTAVKNQIIIEIDGIPLIFGAVPVTKFARYGEDNIEYGQTGLVYGGVVESEKSRDYISLNGTTSRIKQQIEPDESGVGSITKVEVRLIDLNQELTKAFKPGQNVDDLMTREAVFYHNFEGGAHPEDSIELIRGNIDYISFGAGYVDIEISHPEELKNTDIYERVETELNGAINATQTTITVDDASNFILPADTLTTYARIGGEILQYTGVSGNDLTGVARGQLGTTAAAHDDGAEVTSFYRLQDDAIDMSLKTMLSDGGQTFATRDAKSFVQVDATTTVSNAILFSDEDVEGNLGLVPGDLITVTGSAFASNNVTDKEIIDFEQTPTGSYITVDNVTFVKELNSSATVAFKSKYNTLPAGAGVGMNPKQVDVKRHEDLKTLLSTSIPVYDLYIKDTEEAAEFINQKVYFPSGFYNVPRKGKVSLNSFTPPLATTDTVRLDHTNIVNPADLEITRTINEHFFNKIVYEFNEDPLEDSLNSKRQKQATRGAERLKKFGKTLRVKAPGLRKNAATLNAIDRAIRRLLDRFQFAAEAVEGVRSLYKDGFKVEVADAVIFGSPQLQMTDSEKGTRSFRPRMMEVLNKSLNIISGRSELDLLDTSFNLDGRYGVIGPASNIKSGATTTEIPLKKSYSTGDNEKEKAKWQQYIGEKVLIHSPDWTYQETSTILKFDETKPDVMILKDAVSTAPLEDYIVDMPIYSNTSTNLLWKNVHCYFCPQVEVTAGVNSTTFDVALADIDKFFVGGFVRIHNLDYSVDSIDAQDPLEITDISSNRITVNASMGFTPAAGYLVELIGFKDEGDPYRYF